MLKNVYVAGGARTPFGSFSGGLASKTAGELGSLAIRNALTRAGVGDKDVDEVMMGNVIGAGLGQNVARQASIYAGLPVECGATTINKVCGSALRTVVHAAQAIQCGDAGLILAGGCESMSNAPYLLRKARTGYRMGNGELIDGMIYDGLWDVYSDRHMGVCGDECAAKYDISRQAQDDFAIASFERAIKAWDDGFYAESVKPVEIATRKGTTTVEQDEDVASFRGADKLRALRPAFGKEGTITAGNASTISDGAAAMVVFGDEKKKALDLKPAARILGYTNVATEPGWFTIAPFMAIRKLCELLNITPDDVDLFEINEAFAVVTLLAMRELKIPHEKVNVAGGAVSIGHPIGASGSRIAITLVDALHAHNKKMGIAAICLGGGEATAMAFERC